jgi:hypothetical protein
MTLMSAICRPALPGFLIGEFMNMAWIDANGRCVGSSFEEAGSALRHSTPTRNRLACFPPTPKPLRWFGEARETRRGLE